MSRQQVLVREAVPSDAEALVRLWHEAGHGLEQLPGLSEQAPRALRQISEAPDDRLMVGVLDGQVVCALHMWRGRISPLHTETVVHTSFLLVRPDYRRHGCAQALLLSAVAFAEECGVEHVTAITNSSSRDSNRYLARLGLATVATFRMASVSLLRSKLAPEGRLSGRRHHHVLAQRRSMRRRDSLVPH